MPRPAPEPLEDPAVTRRTSIALVLLVLAATGLLAGCSGRSGRGEARAPRNAADSLADWRARADSIDRSLPALSRVDGELKLGVATSRYSAWFAGGELRAIHDELSMGPQGARTSRFYFVRDVPRFVDESGTVLAGSVQAPALRKLEREMIFDDAGTLALGRKELDGAPAPVEAFEGMAIVGHAQQLRLDAQLRRSGTAPDTGGVAHAAR